MNVRSCQYHQQSALLFAQRADNLDGQNGGYLGVNARDVTDEGGPIDQHKRRRRREEDGGEETPVICDVTRMRSCQKQPQCSL